MTPGQFHIPTSTIVVQSCKFSKISFTVACLCVYKHPRARVIVVLNSLIAFSSSDVSYPWNLQEQLEETGMVLLVSSLSFTKVFRMMNALRSLHLGWMPFAL